MTLKKIFPLVLVAVLCFSLGAWVQQAASPAPITAGMLAEAEQLIDLPLTPAERDSMLEGLEEQRSNYQHLRAVALANSVTPVLQFNPVPAGMSFSWERKAVRYSKVPTPAIPENLEDLAFATVGELSQLIRSRKITSEQLTRMYLNRLKKYGPILECVITLNEEGALAQARKADAEIAAGRYRGPLHGIPYGAKDLLAARGMPTTWGAAPYRNQVFDEDATVIRKLEAAGAVLAAKLTMGALAWGDVWFGGKTRNPWNLEQGSSGSSAGSASATSAGLVGFAIGTETWGSIVSPSTRCGVTGLRPTYGRVSRHGAMALSWSMDKIGPICRSVEDCAMVFEAISGPDSLDQTLYDLPFNYDAMMDVSRLKIGFLESAFAADTVNQANNQRTLQKLREMGFHLIPVKLPDYPVMDISFILTAEAGAAFDELTRSGRDDLLVRQIKDAWPNVFRLSRFIPAVEYINANRVRNLIIQGMKTVMDSVDLYVSPSFGDNLLLTNLTGHPCVVLPNGFSKKGTPTSISFIGGLFEEAELLSFARRYQEATGFHLQHPSLPAE